MSDRLKKFLDEEFAPYGEFPARADVVQELLADLRERYDELREQGLSDDDAYKATIESFGDIAEIMEHVPYGEIKKTKSTNVKYKH
jgi:hypothetical protein